MTRKLHFLLTVFLGSLCGSSLHAAETPNIILIVADDHDEVTVSLDADRWTRTLRRPGFAPAKKKLLWMQNGGQQGLELDDIIIKPTKR